VLSIRLTVNGEVWVTNIADCALLIVPFTVNCTKRSAEFAFHVGLVVRSQKSKLFLL